MGPSLGFLGLCSGEVGSAKVHSDRFSITGGWWIVFAPMVLVVALAGAVVAGDDVVGLPLTGQEAVEFLRTAEIKGKPKEFDSLAITDPVRVTLTDGSRTFRAIFKDEDTYHMKFHYGDGRTLTRVKDSYKSEIAAYELDVLLGLDMVPPCVERSVQSHTGSLCMWVEEAMTESDRIKQQIQPPNAVEWNNQMFTLRLFHQLIWDPDYNNVRNTLVDANFKIYKIDSSMAFRTDSDLRKEKSLTRFSRKVLASLEALERSEVDARLGPWLDKKQLDALWARRGRLLELAKERIADSGEDAVLYD